MLGVGNLAFGAVALVAPGRVAGFIGFELLTPEASGELRAVFGGLVLVLGGLMLGGLRHSEGRAWLRALALVFGGLAFGRMVSLLVDGPNSYTFVALALEALSAVLLALDPRRHRRHG